MHKIFKLISSLAYSYEVFNFGGIYHRRSKYSGWYRCDSKEAPIFCKFENELTLLSVKVYNNYIKDSNL